MTNHCRLAPLLALVLTGCASTTFYYSNGKRQARFEGDMSGVFYAGHGVKFKADQLLHSTATRAIGESTGKVIGSAGTAAAGVGAAIIGKGVAK